MAAPMDDAHFWFFLYCFVLYGNMCATKGEILASKHKAEEIERTRCGYDLQLLWSSEIAQSQFASAPLITDVDGDGKLDIVAAPFTETFTVVVGDTGTSLPQSLWPSQRLDTSILASPLQYDIDGDGMLDLLFCTSSGEFLFYKHDGTFIEDKRFQLPPVYVEQGWYDKAISLGHASVHDLILDAPPSSKIKNYVSVDPHVLSSPVIVDLNADRQPEELVLPVTYYFDKEEYRLTDKTLQNNLTFEELDRYLAGAIVVFNLTSMTIIRTIHLDLTEATSEYPGYVLFTPTVIDLDSSGGEMEIIIGTSAGNIHIIESTGKHRSKFPIEFGPIDGQITVADVNDDGQLEVIVIDTSGNVHCLSSTGSTLWEADISGMSLFGSRLADVNQDGRTDVVVTAANGYIYALDGGTGNVLPKWPVKIGARITANVLITRVSSNHSVEDMVVLSEDGNVHVISTDLTCRTHFAIGENSLVQILSHDLVSQSKGLELLVSTNDGTLMCFGSMGPQEDMFNTSLLAQASETRSPNTFSYLNDERLMLSVATKALYDITGSSFWVEFTIISTRKTSKNTIYKIQVYYGAHLLVYSDYHAAGVYHLQVPTWTKPGKGHVTVTMTNEHGQIYHDSFVVRFNLLILQDLLWLLTGPFVAMTTILLINHGFPAKDLLPFTHSSKTR